MQSCTLCARRARGNAADQLCELHHAMFLSGWDVAYSAIIAAADAFGYENVVENDGRSISVLLPDARIDNSGDYWVFEDARIIFRASGRGRDIYFTVYCGRCIESSVPNEVTRGHPHGNADTSLCTSYNGDRIRTYISNKDYMGAIAQANETVCTYTARDCFWPLGRLQCYSCRSQIGSSESVECECGETLCSSCTGVEPDDEEQAMTDLCNNCSYVCRRCSERVSVEPDNFGRPVEEAEQCQECSSIVCPNCINQCPACEGGVCLRCQLACIECAETFCMSCLDHYDSFDGRGAEHVCEKCLTDYLEDRAIRQREALQARADAVAMKLEQMHHNNEYTLPTDAERRIDRLQEDTAAVHAMLSALDSGETRQSLTRDQLHASRRLQYIRAARNDIPILNTEWDTALRPHEFFGVSPSASTSASVPVGNPQPGSEEWEIENLPPRQEWEHNFNLFRESLERASVGLRELRGETIEQEIEETEETGETEGTEEAGNDSVQLPF